MRLYTDIKLRAVEWSDGFPTPTVTERTVQGWITSASRMEFYSAKTAGYYITNMVTIMREDYHGEEECEVDGVVYRIVREYITDSQRLQLSLERR